MLFMFFIYTQEEVMALILSENQCKSQDEHQATVKKEFHHELTQFIETQTSGKKIEDFTDFMEPDHKIY